MTRFLDSVRQELAGLEAAGLFRTLRPLEGPLGPTVRLAGRAVLNFSSNDYLGLAGDPRLLPTPSPEGHGAGASRLIAGNLAAHRALEAELADWLGCEATLLFSSGYAANVGLLSSVAGPGDQLFSDELNHASLIDGCRLSRASVVVYPHADVDALARLLAAAPPARRRLIVTDSVFSMDGDRAPLAALVELATRFDAAILVDEAHAFGALGPGGRGVGSDLPLDVRVGTLGKAFGCAGAFVAGPRPVIELLQNRARSFVFSTAPSVPLVQSARQALALVRSAEGDSRRVQLAANCEQFHVELRRQGLSLGAEPSHIVPLRVRDGAPSTVVQLSRELLDAGLFAHPIRPPTVPPGTSRLRLSLMATHTAEQLRTVADLIGQHRHRLA